LLNNRWFKIVIETIHTSISIAMSTAKKSTITLRVIVATPVNMLDNFKKHGEKINFTK
jgi:hypothetical protein